MKTDNCPKCGVSWDGGLILYTFLKQREEGIKCWQEKSNEQIEDEIKSSYSPPYRWKREIGIELPYNHPNHYDGVSYWQCPDCKALFNRFTEEEVDVTSLLP